ncbi:MAG: hypothetical protein WBX15_12700 [Thermoanaerobaculia bacterium]
MNDRPDWTARRIFAELCDPETRTQMLTYFWKHAEDHVRIRTIMTLAKALHFREETIRKAPAEKKAAWLATRMSSPEFEDALEMGLMIYLTREKKEMLGAFLDFWGIPHEEGAIEVDEYEAPTEEKVESAVEQLAPRFPRQEMTIYLAAAGLLMGQEWRDSAWPVVNRLVSS